jgi:hypothetical protein
MTLFDTECELCEPEMGQNDQEEIIADLVCDTFTSRKGLTDNKMEKGIEELTFQSNCFDLE